MNCEKTNGLIMKYFDGEVNDIEEAQLMQHLKACGTCNDEFGCLKEALTAVGAVYEIEPPEDFEVRVMDRVNAVEFAKKQRYSQMLVMLYNAASMVSIILMLVFVADIRQVDVLGILGRIQEYFGSFSSATTAVLGVANDLFSIVGSIFKSLFIIGFTVIKAYYHVILAMLVMLAAIQGVLVYAARDGGKGQ